MRISAPAETAPGETRVALVPRSITQLIATGATVAIQAGAGMAAGLPDAAYTEVGATIVADRAALLADADIVMVVRRPDAAFVKQLDFAPSNVAFDVFVSVHSISPPRNETRKDCVDGASGSRRNK